MAPLSHFFHNVLFRFIPILGIIILFVKQLQKQGGKSHSFEQFCLSLAALTQTHNEHKLVQPLYNYKNLKKYGDYLNVNALQITF